MSGYDKQPFSVNQNTNSASGNTVLFHSSSFPSTPAFPFSKPMALKKTQSYESTFSLNQAPQEELMWWTDHLTAWNGRSLLRKENNLLIETDASNLGWGVLSWQLMTSGLGSSILRHSSLFVLERILNLRFMRCCVLVSASRCTGLSRPLLGW